LPTCRRGRLSCGGIFDLEAKQKRLSEVETLLSDAKVWSDPQRAQELGKEKKAR
jgi:peptide chain release factor 2